MNTATICWECPHCSSPLNEELIRKVGRRVAKKETQSGKRSPYVKVDVECSSCENKISVTFTPLTTYIPSYVEKIPIFILKIVKQEER